MDGDDMNVCKRIVMILIGVVFTGVLAVVSLFIYEEQFRKEEVYRESSPDGRYTVVLSQVGSPGWPFGPVKAEIKVLDSDGKTVDRKSVVVHTDGGQLSIYNIETIDWCDDVLKVACVGEDGVAVYTLEYSKTK